MEQKRAPKLPNSLSAAVLETGALFGTDSSSVEERARELLKIAPGQPHALMLMASARRLAGDVAGARDLLRGLATAEPGLAAIQYELGLVSSDLGDTEAAIAAFTRVTDLEPRHPDAWRALGDQLSKVGEAVAAGKAYAKYFETHSSEVQSLDPAARPGKDQFPSAELGLRTWLETRTTDVVALRMLAGVCLRLGRQTEAEKYLSQVLDLSPNFSVARWTLVLLLAKRADWEKTLPHLEHLLKEQPDNSEYLNMKAEALLNAVNSEGAVASFETLLPKRPTAEAWMHYGHALRLARRQQDCIAAYRKAIALKPYLGQAYWSLANLKTFRFEPVDIQAMSDMLERENLDRSNRSQMHFALGKAFEDAKQYAPSFEQYRKGNAAWRKELQHDADEMSAMVRRNKAVFNSEFYRQRPGAGSSTADPIFIVGLPRSGSTLIEQILSSHSLVEGAGELTALKSVAERLADVEHAGGGTYPQILLKRTTEELKSAGDEYIARTWSHRKLGRPYFIDKMPSNFYHLGLLFLVLPNAKIIDARRHPLGTGFANFKQFYPDGQTFTFDLAEIGRYYRDYVEMVAHFDALFPGRIHRVFYERMVTNTEQEIRLLLDYCGLPFEQGCLQFYETKRDVMTASSEQVRQPIFTDGLAQWRAYEQWLEPLKTALGPVLDNYPCVPD